MKIDTIKMNESLRPVAITLINNNVNVYVKKGYIRKVSECYFEFIYFELDGIDGVYIATEGHDGCVSLYEIAADESQTFLSVAKGMSNVTFDMIVHDIEYMSKGWHKSYKDMKAIICNSEGFEYIPLTIEEFKFQTFTRKVF